MKRLGLLFAATFVALAAPAFGNPAEEDRLSTSANSQGPAAGERTPADFGMPQAFYSNLESFALVPYGNAMTYTRSPLTGGLFCTGGTENRAVGQIQMPHGVDLGYARIWDRNLSAQAMTARVEEACLPDFAAALPTVTVLANFTTAAGAGDSTQSQDIVNRRVDNSSCSYRLIVQFGDTAGAACPGSSQWFYKVRLEWQRIAPPAPAVATFSDVPTGDPFFQVIEALADSNITVGCGGTNFCPTQPVTRAAMAAFLVRALALQPAFFPDPANP